ncbi:DUF922 domain-containing protein [Pontibacter oryzae]|nr:DUF922 domain-containing protein [Pontibacter oryzae]
MFHTKKTTVHALRRLVSGALLSIALLLMSAICFGQEVEQLFWSETPLQAQDYTLMPDNIDTGKLGVFTYTHVSYKYTFVRPGSILHMKMVVTAGFIKEKSWIKAHAMKDKNALAHEQLHFDLTELYARKLTKAFAEAKPTDNFKEAFDAVFQQVFNELKEQQQQYDLETDHGFRGKKQQYWHNHVKNELNAHAAWADKVLVYNVDRSQAS